MTKLYFAFLFILAACSPVREPIKARAQIPSVPNISEKINAKIESPLKIDAGSATDRVALLASDASIKHRYVFLKAVQSRDTDIVGRIDVNANPFVQFALSSEMLKRDDLDTFIKKVELAHKNGQIGGLEWAAFVTAEKAYQLTGSEWGLRKIQTKATNQQVESAFPGIFGDATTLQNSLPLSWIRKFDGGIEPTNSEVAKIFASSLPLIGFEDLYEDFRSSMSAAIQFDPLDISLSQTERASSVMLFERMFAQLLTIKGYTAVKYNLSNGIYAVPKLTDDEQSFASIVKPGYFIDAATGKAVALSPIDIASYDPAKRLLLLSSGGGSGAAGLSEELSFVMAMGLAFEVSSPAAFYVTAPNRYLFGDVQSIANRAIVPGDAHSLAFGLLAMELQNIAARHIAEVNAQGQDVNVGGGATQGIAIYEDVNGKKLVQLEPVLKMIRFYIQIDSAINDILKKNDSNPSELKSMNSFYQSSDAISNLLTLQSKLKDLRLGLYLLTMRLVKANTERMYWDPKFGFSPSNQLGYSVERKRQIGSVLRDLGVYMDQPFIYQDGIKLLGDSDL